jgi:molybdate transport system substrate-binding protein
MIIMRSNIAVAALAGGIIVLTAAAVADAAEIAVLGPPQSNFVLSALIPMFEKDSGDRVVMSYEAGAAAIAKVKAGVNLDLAIMGPDQIDGLVKEGKIAAGRTDVFISGIGLAVKAGAPKPDISTVDALRMTLLAAKSVARSNARSGTYFASVLERLGIADQMKSKIIVVQVGPVGAAAANGDAEIAVQQLTELMPVPGIELVGPLPPELQDRILYSAGIPVSARQPDAARTLIRFFASPKAAPIDGLRAHRPVQGLTWRKNLPLARPSCVGPHAAMRDSLELRPTHSALGWHCQPRLLATQGERSGHIRFRLFFGSIGRVHTVFD